MFEQLSNIYGIGVNIIGIMSCLFYYIVKQRRAWVYALGFLLACFLSNYYWGIYVLVMGDYPNVSSFFAYFGWNIGLFILPIMQFDLMTKDERRYFSPFAVIPIALNIYQFILYIPFGGVLNRFIQGLFSTVSITMSVNSIAYYMKNKKNGAKPPFVAYSCFGFITFEYIMWTSSCFDWPSEWLYPYNYACILDFAFYLLIPKMILMTYNDSLNSEALGDRVYIRKAFRPMYAGFVLLCCVGGYFLAKWMKITLSAGIDEAENSDPYSVIAVMLFVLSCIILFVTISIMFVVNLINKAAESEELREAKIIAEHSNAAKSDFLANMSHEIRTPINAVLGMNEMILRESVRSRDELPEDRQEIIDTFADICNNSWNIDSAGKSLLSLINDILDFSKIEAGKLELVDGDYKLSSVINDVCNMISFKAEAKKLKFNVNVNEETPDSLYGDEIRVRQVVTNLLNNAVKYTHKGSVSFNVDFKKHDDEEVIDLIVNVKDTGVGIKEEDVDKLFTKFERVDLEKNSTIEGTGLGLAITKSLVEMMDGEIKVESVYGEGSTFKFLIPQKYTSAEPIGDFRDRFKKTVSALTARKESIYAPEAKILVVDDTAMNLMVVKGLLRNSKINIDTAESGRDAIELAKESKYDIIFMDQRMPVMDGVTAMRIIKEESDTNLDTPIICLTADAISGAKDKYIAEGFTDYLSKPISVQELEQMLFDYLPEDKIKNKE